MTIQNIEDVMERIMSLNRNLNEESLKTLLSASGWDREDILEGLRIFRATNKSTVAATPIISKSVDQEQIDNNIPEPKPQPEVIQEDILQEKPYTFNLKKKEEDAPVVALNVSLPGKGRVLEKAEETAAGVVNFMNSGETSPTATLPTVVATEKTEKTTEKKSGSPIGIILLLLAFLLLAVAGAYLYLPAFTKWVNKTFSIQPKQGVVIQDVSRNQVNQNPNIPNQPADPNINPNPNYTIPTPIINVVPTTSTSSTGEVYQTIPIATTVSDAQVRELMAEIEKLKSDLNRYKNSIPEVTTQTIVRYVSQKGATGATGRGIASVTATTTGFIINYTDLTSEIVPYSTSTLLDVLNSQRICFRDMNATTSSSTDACLDKNTVLNLLNR